MTSLIRNNSLLWKHLARTRKDLGDTEPLLTTAGPPPSLDRFLDPVFTLSAFFPHPSKPTQLGGLVVAELVEHEMLYLRLLWVHPDLRGGGMAAKLLGSWLDLVIGSGEQFDYITTDIRLVLIPLFTSYRFEPAGHPPDLDDGQAKHPEAPEADKKEGMPSVVNRYHRFVLRPRICAGGTKHWRYRPSRSARGEPSVFCQADGVPAFVVHVDRGMRFAPKRVRPKKGGSVRREEEKKKQAMLYQVALSLTEERE